MPSLSTLLGKTGGELAQLFLWGVLEQVFTEALAPMLRDLQHAVNDADPNVILTPDILADAVVRKIKTQDTAAAEAHSSGVTAKRFADMVHLAGEPPGIESILQWYRRGIVEWGEAGPTKATVANAIATSRIYTYWGDTIRRALVVPIPAAEMVNARVENQTGLGTRGAATARVKGGTAGGITPDATTFYEAMAANGFTPDQADLMWRVRGNPPSPTELFELYRRGKIPLTGTGPTELTVQQGIVEGATKDKWWPTVTGLIPDIPSLYYVHMMLKTGEITAALAAHLYHESGYTTQVIAALTGVGVAAKANTYLKLTESLIVKLYTDKTISRTTALSLLAQIGWGKTAATFALTAADLTLSVKAMDSARTKIGTLFIARKITAKTATAALTALGVIPSAIAQVLQTWTLERTASVKLLTEAQIVDGWEYGALTGTEALEELQAIGYTPYDAWVLLSVKNKAPLPTKPPKTLTSIGEVT